MTLALPDCQEVGEGFQGRGGRDPVLGPEKGGILSKGLRFGKVHPGTQESKPARHPHSKEA